MNKMASKNTLINIPIILFLLLTLTIFEGILAVEYTVNNNAATTQGGMVFTNQIGTSYAHQTLSSATNFIWQTFQENDDTTRKHFNQVDLFILPILQYDAPAKTINNQIQLSANYLGNYRGDLIKEFAGVILHEMTHVWQWNGTGQVYQQNRGGLIEGIADFVRLKSGLIPSYWARPGDGNSWDQGYDVTARFLDYCDGLMSGFVAQLNRKMRFSYSDGFFHDLLGKTVDQLWSEYKATYGH